MTYKQNVNQKVRYNLLKFIIFLEDIAVDFLLFMSRLKRIIPEWIVDNFWNIILFLLFILPPIFCEIFECELPGIYIIYAIIMGVAYLMKFANMMDKSQSNTYGYQSYDEHEMDSYPKRNPYKYIYDPMAKQKDKNGGLTDKEVKERKKDIWKKLSKC